MSAVRLALWFAWACASQLAAQARAAQAGRELILQRQVENALQSVRSVLNITLRPQYPVEVPHAYDDKYLLSEFATKAAASGLVNLLENMAGEPGWWSLHKAALSKWAAAGQVVTLRFSGCQRCEFERTETRDLDSGSKTVSETLGGWVSSSVKTVTTVKEHFWQFNGTWEISAFPGAQVSERVVLRRVTGLHRLKTTTSKNEEAVPPHKEMVCREPLDLDIGWLVVRAGSGSLDFAVNRSDPHCRTPRRNPDIAAALGFFEKVLIWSDLAASYFRNELFAVQQGHSLDVRAVGRGQVVRPVLALFALDPARPAGQQRPALAESFSAVMSEHRRSLRQDVSRLEEIFPASGGLITAVPAAVTAALLHLKQLADDLISVVNAIEQMLYDQLTAAVGKELKSADFAEYMDFHYRRLMKAEFGPSAFSYAVRRPGQSPEGTISIEAPAQGGGGSHGASMPIQTVAVRRVPVQSMRISLSAAVEVGFVGDAYLHPIVMHRFSREPPQSLSLVARARQFSSFMLLVGRVISADRFHPTAALIIKDRDDLSVPLLLETVPAPKEFADAIASLSPEQKAFARAFREMQLSSTLFGLCIIQIKPQMEQVLNLPPNSLTKEIRLTQDLMELFIKYQVPSDLLSYDDGPEVQNRSKLQVVKDNVAGLLATINASRQRELEEQREEAQQRRLASQGYHCEECQAYAGPADIHLEEDEVEDDGNELGMGVPKKKESVFKHFSLSGASVRLASLRNEEHRDYAERTQDSLTDLAENTEVLEIKHAVHRALKRSVRPDKSASSTMPQSAAATTAPSSTAPHAPTPQPTPAPPLTSDRVARELKEAKEEGPVDFAALPGLLDSKFAELDEDGTLRPTKIMPGLIWSKKEGAGLLSPLVDRTLDDEVQVQERNRAFDLLDALTRSGAQLVRHASLHVVLMATHGFDLALADAIVQGNVNPIEKVERSVLIMASTLQQQPPEALLAPDQLSRVRRASPVLFDKLEE